MNSKHSLVFDRIFAISCGSILGTVMIVFSVYALASYGAVLFLLTPLIAATLSALIYSVRRPDESGWTFWVSFLSLMLPACLLLAAGLEGLICIAMAALPAAICGFLGMVIGRAAAERFGAKTSHAALMIIFLPLAGGVESTIVTAPLNEVVTAIEIDAPPEAVWPHVIGYSSLPDPTEWLFRTGIGYPQKVWMEGEGVGAMRYCGFSTGIYSEAITRWEPPYRLSFDVTNTPPAMKELSFYDEVHAPHLKQTPRNHRGEFRLTRLPGNRTRLEGSTWYDIEMYPQFYWRLWADATVHAVHQRVFSHIKEKAEASSQSVLSQRASL